MKIVVLLISVVLFGVTVALTVSSEGGKDSYAELADKTITPKYDAFLKGLKNFDKDAAPEKVKPFRGPLADARTMIDIFAYAFPPSLKKSGKDDIFLSLVKDLTEGHNILGEYSDMGSVKYTKKEKENLLDKCLTWKEKFLKNRDSFEYDKLVHNPDKEKMHSRKKGDLSGHFWGHVDAEPSLKLTGLENVAVLQDGQLKSIVDRFEKFVGYTNIWDETVHASFHNFRKDLRYCHQVYSAFNDIYRDEKAAKKGLAMIPEAEHALGPINNRIESYFFYKKHGNKAKANKLKKEVEDLWTKEKARLKKDGFLETVKELRKNLIKH